MDCREPRLSAIADRYILNVHIAMSAHKVTICSNVEDIRHPPIYLSMWIVHFYRGH